MSWIQVEGAAYINSFPWIQEKWGGSISGLPWKRVGGEYINGYKTLSYYKLRFYPIQKLSW